MTPEQEREFRALLAEVDEENSGWRSVMDPVAAELRSLRAEVAILKEQLTEAGDFGGRESERVDALSAHLEGAKMVALGAKEEARDLRAALAASQAREATFRAKLAEVIGAVRRPPPEMPEHGVSVADDLHREVAALLADSSPVAEALGRVVRASVEFILDDSMLDWGDIDRAVRSLLAVAPHWGEPRGAE